MTVGFRWRDRLWGSNFCAAAPRGSSGQNYKHQLTPTGRSCWMLISQQRFFCWKQSKEVSMNTDKRNLVDMADTGHIYTWSRCEVSIEILLFVVRKPPLFNNCSSLSSSWAPAQLTGWWCWGASGKPYTWYNMVYWWYMVFKWYAIQPIHGAVVRLTWYAAVAGVTSVALNLSVPQCTLVYPSVPQHTR